MELSIMLPLAAVTGALLGASANLLSRLMVKRRSPAELSLPYLNRRFSIVIWIVGFAALLTGAAAVFGGDIKQTVHFAVMLFACGCISAVDLAVRKVPNPMVLLLLVNTAVFAALAYPDMQLGQRFLAMMIGLVVFAIPSYFKLYVGWGDVKLAVAVALDLMMISFLQSMAIMGIAVLILGLLLIATKKGDFKSKVPMGPFISLGMVITTLFPLF